MLDGQQIDEVLEIVNYEPAYSGKPNYSFGMAFPIYYSQRIEKEAYTRTVIVINGEGYFQVGEGPLLFKKVGDTVQIPANVPLNIETKEKKVTIWGINVYVDDLRV